MDQKRNKHKYKNTLGILYSCMCVYIYTLNLRVRETEGWREKTWEQLKGGKKEL